MIHRPSRRDIVKTTAVLTAAGSLRHATSARAQAPTSPKPGTFSQIDAMLRAATSGGEVPGVVALAATVLPLPPLDAGVATAVVAGAAAT